MRSSWMTWSDRRNSAISTTSVLMSLAGNVCGLRNSTLDFVQYWTATAWWKQQSGLEDRGASRLFVQDSKWLTESVSVKFICLLTQINNQCSKILNSKSNFTNEAWSLTRMPLCDWQLSKHITGHFWHEQALGGYQGSRLCGYSQSNDSEQSELSRL